MGGGVDFGLRPPPLYGKNLQNTVWSFPQIFLGMWLFSLFAEKGQKTHIFVSLGTQDAPAPYLGINPKRK